MLKNVKILCGPLWKRLDCCTNWESVDNDMVQHTISKHSSSKSSSTLWPHPLKPLSRISHTWASIIFHLVPPWRHSCFHAASILLPYCFPTASMPLSGQPRPFPAPPPFFAALPTRAKCPRVAFLFSPQTVMHLGTSGPNWISCGVKEKQENHSCILSIDVTRREATRRSNLNFHVSSWEKRG